MRNVSSGLLDSGFMLRMLRNDGAWVNTHDAAPIPRYKPGP